MSPPPHSIDQSKTQGQPRFKDWGRSLYVLKGEVHCKGHAYTEGQKTAIFAISPQEYFYWNKMIGKESSVGKVIVNS